LLDIIYLITRLETQRNIDKHKDTHKYTQTHTLARMYEISKFILFIILIIFFTIILSILYKTHLLELFLEYRNSSNGKTYGIQEKMHDSHVALELLSKLDTNMSDFVTRLQAKYPNDDRVQRLVKGYKHVKIEETTEERGDDDTSFTINKGELMSICLRAYKNTDTERPFHDYNSLCFVMIHEMAHIASISEGHNFEFIENFKFLLKEAVSMGYYNPVDYSKNPFMYCGKVKVTNNPFY